MTPFFFHTYIILLHTNKKIIKNVHVNNLEEKIIDSVNNHEKIEFMSNYIFSLTVR